jgi:hypothetical protein
LVVSDGAGSCEHSHHGSESAVASSIEFCVSNNGRFAEAPIEEIANDLISYVLAGLATVADKRSVTLKSLSCTLLVAVWSPHYCAAFQIGDGTLSVELISARPSELPSGIVATLFVDDSEYVNETTFITSSNPKIQYQSLNPSLIRSFILGTDGIDPLATAGVCASEAFYSPILQSIRASVDDNKIFKLEEEMSTFLDSKVARERSDDDKTLLIATV